MSNRKEILIIKYLEFKQHLDSIEFNTALFPSLEDVDIVDLLFFFNLFFPESPDYEASVRSVATNFGYKYLMKNIVKGCHILQNISNG